MHKIDKSETAIDYISIDFVRFGTKKKLLKKRKRKTGTKTKCIALTNTKARLHQNNATRREKRKHKQKQKRKRIKPTKANTSCAELLKHRIKHIH